MTNSSLVGSKLAAKDICSKMFHVSLDQLTSAIRTLAGGGTLVHPAITQRLLNNIDRSRGSKRRND